MPGRMSDLKGKIALEGKLLALLQSLGPLGLKISHSIKTYSFFT